MPMVPSKLRVRAFEGGISVGLWFLDAMEAHISLYAPRKQVRVGITRSCGPSCSDYAARNFSILCRILVSH